MYTGNNWTHSTSPLKKRTLGYWWGMKQSSKNYRILHFMMANTSNGLPAMVYLVPWRKQCLSLFYSTSYLLSTCEIVSAAAQLCGFNVRQVIFLSILNVWCIYYMVWVVIGHCGRYKVRVHNWSSHPWQVQLTEVRGGGPSSLPTSSRRSAREREECKWVHSRKPSPAPSTLKSPLTLPDRDILQP